MAKAPANVAAADGAGAVVQRHLVTLRLPLVPWSVEVPRRLLPYYIGLGAMAVLDVIEWPLALLIAAGHTVASQAHNKALRELAEGIESGG
jgi:hypothetical protein